MRVVITGCSDSLFWYKDFVGEEFDVLGEDPTEFVVLEPNHMGGYLNIIKKKDAEVLSEKLPD